MLHFGAETQQCESLTLLSTDGSLVQYVSPLNEVFHINNSVCSAPFILCPKTINEIRVNHAASNLFKVDHKDASDQLKSILSVPYCSTSSRIRILYLLGVGLLKRIRQNGCLQAIWNDNICGSPLCGDITVAVDNAKNYFTECIALQGSEKSGLARSCKRYLALLAGPVDQETDTLSPTLLFVNSSIGQISQRYDSVIHLSPASCALNDRDNILGETLMNKIRNLDSSLPSLEDLVNDCRHHMVSGWKFISATICPSGEMLLTSIETGSRQGGLKQYATCIFPTDNGGDSSIYDELLVPLDAIIERSETHLSTPPNHSSSDSKQESRRWWDERSSLDSALQQLLERCEEMLFRSEPAREIFSLKCNESETNIISGRNLHSIFDAAFYGNTSSTPQIDRHADSANIEELRDDFSSLAIDSNSVNTESPICAQPKETLNVTTHAKNSSECIFLVLDENLQRFPFESLPCLKGRSVCRLPSLGMGLVRMKNLTADPLHVDVDLVSYILDPESNLVGTRERLLSWIHSMQIGLENWDGVVGSPPPQGFIERALTTRNGMLLYFGHGNGKQYFSQRVIESLQHPDKESICSPQSSILASIVLMGCSSGKLASVNVGDTNPKIHRSIHYEPEGVALSYLLAGSPCVVANLWDVTDRDIDRFSIALLSGLNDASDHRPISQRVSDARHSCKMRYIVGGAPVCYGFPVTSK
jgi:separase